MIKRIVLIKDSWNTIKSSNLIKPVTLTCHKVTQLHSAQWIGTDLKPAYPRNRVTISRQNVGLFLERLLTVSYNTKEVTPGERYFYS